MLIQPHLSNSQIDWSHINEMDFNALAEVLLVKVHNQPPYRVEVIRGHGGDTGIDVVVWLDGRASRIYQLKYFPGGMSGKNVQRREQVTQSFNTAWAKHAPDEWILVMPSDPTIRESYHVTALAQGKSVKVDIWGKSKLTSELANFPDLEHAFTKNELVELLVRMVLAKDGDDNSQNAVLNVSGTDNPHSPGNNLLVQNTGGVDAREVTMSIATDPDEYAPTVVTKTPATITANGNWMFKIDWSSASTNNLLVTLKWIQNGTHRTATQSISMAGVHPTRTAKRSS